MRNYETPELIVTELDLEDVVASTFTEGGDGEAGWLDSWMSGLN